MPQVVSQLLLPSALELQRLGVSVIPVRLNSKKPAVKWKRYQHERADEATLRTWFADIDNSQLGIGVVLGEVSGGLLVRDFDEQSAFENWKQAKPKLAAALPVVQASRGPHVWFRSQGYKRADAPSFVRSFSDGELRGDGHFVVVPPSLHPRTGQPYLWLRKPENPIPFVDLLAFGFGAPMDVTQAISVLLPPSRAAPCDQGEQRGRGTSETVEMAISRSLPTRIGQRHRKIFEFARWLKSIPELTNCHAAGLESHVRQWHSQALPVIGTKDFKATWKDFRAAWLRVRSPAGVGSLTAALQRSAMGSPPPEAEQFKSPKIRMLVGLCRELQRERGDAPFFLSCRDAAAALGLPGNEPHVTAWRWLRLLCEKGIIQPGSTGSLKDRKASEFRYLQSLA